MDLVVIALVCSQLAVPDHADCMVDTSLHHQRLEVAANSETMCEFNGMVAAASLWQIDPKFEYVKVMCVLPSFEINRMPG